MSETAYHLNFDGTTLRFTPPDSLGWEVPLAQILLIGESSFGGAELGNVPCLAITDRSGKCYFAPIDAPGFALAVQGLALALKTEIRLTYTKTRAYQSRVIAPAGLRDRPMFEFESVRPRGFFARMFRAPVVEQRLTDEMLEVLLASAKRAARSRHPAASRATSSAARGQRRTGPSAQYRIW